MANFVVTTLDDTIDPNDGQLSLREALALANGNNSTHDTITFAADLSGGTLFLTNGQLAITTDGITINGDINGDGQADITVDAGGQSRVFNINDFTPSTISTALNGLVITNGDPHLNTLFGGGGGIYVGYADALTLTNSTVSDNTAVWGGGIYGYTNSRITLSNSTVTGNYSSESGAGIRGIFNSVIKVTNSTVSGNTAYGYGGGIYVGGIGASLTLTNSIVSGNSAAGNGGGIQVAGSATANLTNSTVTGNS